MKFGYQGAYHTDNRAPGGNDVAFRFNNAIPNQLTEYINYFRSYSRVRYDALYAQDNFTRGRLTVQGAVRFDHSWSYYPEQSIGGVTFLPGTTVFPESTRRRGIQRHHPSHGRLVRPVRQRQDRAEVQHGPVSRGRGERQRQLLGAAAVLARVQSA